jgi:hypothetical protein
MRTKGKMSIGAMGNHVYLRLRQCRQFKRLRQVMLQREGLFGLGHPEIMRELEITDKQRQQFGEVMQEMQKKMEPVMKSAQAGADVMKVKEWSQEERDASTQRNKRRNSAAHLPPGFKGEWWNDEDLALLGTLPDEEIAERTDPPEIRQPRSIVLLRSALWFKPRLLRLNRGVKRRQFRSTTLLELLSDLLPHRRSTPTCCALLIRARSRSGHALLVGAGYSQ